MSYFKVLPMIAALVTVFVVGVVDASSAQGTRTERISFAAGTSGSVLQGRLQGDNIVDYVLDARSGQRMVVDMSTSNASAYFNVMPSGSPEAIFIGNIDGGHFDGTLPESGDWVIRVYLMRSAARRRDRMSVV